MHVIRYPDIKSVKHLVMRPALENASLEASVSNIIREVKENGDQAVKRFTLMFDKVSLDDLLVSPKELHESAALIPGELKKAISIAQSNIEAFHLKQVEETKIIETMPGVKCWRKSIPIQKAGLYIPGGTAPLFSTLLMLAIPAKIAGCKEIILCSPPGREKKLHPAILYAASLSGINRIYKTGGVQAIAAMAFGTETIPQVNKIFGPGNQYVTCAKLLVQKAGIAIDMPAGPSEVAVFADDSANPSFVAADLLSQAEHGADSQVIMVCTSEELINKVEQQLQVQLELLPRKQLAAAALENSKIILVKDENEAITLLNEYAAEHLILACRNAEALAEKVINAGSVFIGHFSPESVGDYASGTNHALPTNGHAKAYSGVSVDSFIKKVTFQQLSTEGLINIGRTVELMAEAEGLHAHKNAVSLRLKEIADAAEVKQ